MQLVGLGWRCAVRKALRCNYQAGDSHRELRGGLVAARRGDGRLPPCGDGLPCCLAEGRAGFATAGNGVEALGS
jgi:hypothetical protein